MDGRLFPTGWAGLLGLILALTACAAGEDYHRPDLDVPASFSATAEDGPAAGSDWWAGFSSPGLNQVMAEAAGGNLDLKAAVARIRQADATLRVSGAQLLPTLDLSLDATRKKSSEAQGSGRVANAYGATLSTSYEIDFWSKNRYAQESAEALARASRFDWQTAMMTVRASVATTYFAWLGARDRRVHRRSSGRWFRDRRLQPDPGSGDKRHLPGGLAQRRQHPHRRSCAADHLRRGQAAG